MESDEQSFLSCAYDRPEVIDLGVSRGLTPAHFTDHHYGQQWKLLVELRTTGGGVDTGSVYALAHGSGRLDSVGGIVKITQASAGEVGTGVSAPAFLSILVTRHAQREAWKLLQRARELVEQNGVDLTQVSSLAEEVVGICSLKKTAHRKVSEIAEEAEADALAVINGTQEQGVLITTGLPNFDKWATAIHSHEYVVVAGRSSHGKSSLCLQTGGHNLAYGKKVAIFTLETSDKSVVKQMAAQRAGVNLRLLAQEMPDRQEKYLKGLAFLKASKNLLIFDRDIELSAIQSRCRLLAQSFKPDLVIIDYMGLIGGTQGSAYERASQASKAMIPLQKQLGCALMVGCQLNQSSEKEEREPSRTDFRDSGQILEDAHRVISVWRKPGQRLDQSIYDYEILQLKLRDGSTAKVQCKFNAAHTKFYEE